MGFTQEQTQKIFQISTDFHQQAKAERDELEQEINALEEEKQLLEVRIEINELQLQTLRDIDSKSLSFSQNEILRYQSNLDALKQDQLAFYRRYAEERLTTEAPYDASQPHELSVQTDEIAVERKIEQYQELMSQPFALASNFPHFVKDYKSSRLNQTNSITLNEDEDQEALRENLARHQHEELINFIQKNLEELTEKHFQTLERKIEPAERLSQLAEYVEEFDQEIDELLTCLFRTLHYYAEVGLKTEVIQVLAELTAENNNEVNEPIDGSLPLNLACRNSHTWIANRLLAKGANPYQEDKYGKTAIDYATENGILDALEIPSRLEAERHIDPALRIDVAEDLDELPTEDRTITEASTPALTPTPSATPKLRENNRFSCLFGCFWSTVEPVHPQPSQETSAPTPRRSFAA